MLTLLCLLTEYFLGKSSVLFSAYMKRELLKASDKASAVDDSDGDDIFVDPNDHDIVLSHHDVRLAIERARTKMGNLLLKDDLKLEELDEVGTGLCVMCFDVFRIRFSDCRLIRHEGQHTNGGGRQRSEGRAGCHL